MFPPLQLCNCGRNQNALQLVLLIAWFGYILRSNWTTLIYCHTVRWREVRVCKECGSGEVEDVRHFVLRCEYVAEERERTVRLMGEDEEGCMEGDMDSNEKVVMMMD